MGAGGFARDKGQRAERAAVKLLQPIINHVFQTVGKEPPQLERNLMQSHKGGHDIIGLDWLALEIKHQETLHINAWWEQTKQQAGKLKEPILMYKQNNVKWRVMLYGYIPSKAEYLQCPVDICLEDFLVYFERRVRDES